MAICRVVGHGLGPVLQQIQHHLLYLSLVTGYLGQRRVVGADEARRIFADIREYAQVSASATQPFGPQLDVPTPETCPFATSTAFGDNELVAIVDFMRAIPPARRRVTPPLPVLSVKRSSVGHIEVLTGSLSRMTDGKRSGEMYTLQPTGDTYALIELVKVIWLLFGFSRVSWQILGAESAR